MQQAITSNFEVIHYTESEQLYTDEQIIEMFLAICERSEYTLRNYRTAITHFKSFLGAKSLQQVTWREVEAFKIGLIQGICSKSGKPQLPATISSFIAPLRSLYKWGSDPNIAIFKLNPTSSVRVPKVQINSRNHYLTKSELSILMQQLQKQGQRDFLIGLTLVLLGLRVSEMTNIHFRDFHTDPSGDSIWLTVTKGKGGKQREIKVPPTLWHILKDRVAFSEINLANEINQRLFPLTTRQVERIIKLARERIQLQKKVSPHWLRHTNATMALLSGASLQQVQENLGHSQMNTTQRYLHTIDQIKKAAPDYVEDYIQDIIGNN